MTRALESVARLGWDFVRSATRQVGSSSQWNGVERFGFFLACPRTGHSLVGALLDAHPEMIFSHELGALRYLRAGFSRGQILQLILENSQRVAEHGRKHFIYSLDVPEAWQGRYERLRAMGDKHGEGAVLRIQAKPDLYTKLCRMFDPIVFVHVIRNPYDSIASIALSKQRGLSLDAAIDYHFSLYATIHELKGNMPSGQCHVVQHERLISEPDESLTALCAHFGLEASRTYLDACGAILFTEPHQTRREIQWTKEQVNQVATRIREFTQLEGYAYEL